MCCQTTQPILNQQGFQLSQRPAAETSCLGKNPQIHGLLSFYNYKVFIKLLPCWNIFLGGGQAEYVPGSLPLIFGSRIIPYSFEITVVFALKLFLLIIFSNHFIVNQISLVFISLGQGLSHIQSLESQLISLYSFMFIFVFGFLF